jgi:hypothetical protein
MAIAKKQHLDGLRSCPPSFLAAAVTTSGELSKDFLFLHQWLTARYREKLMREGDRDDGMKVHDLTPAFRANLRVSICVPVAIARGMAMQLLAAGLPGKCTRNAPALLPTPDLGAEIEGDSDSDEQILQLLADADDEAKESDNTTAIEDGAF